MAAALALAPRSIWSRLSVTAFISVPVISLGLRSIWDDLLPSLLWAVPKKKTSHSRKRMRSANKGLHDKTNIVNCPGCGKAKLAHHVCPSCYTELNHQWKSRQREVGRSTEANE